LGVHGGLVGQTAVTLDRVGDEHAVGHVRLAGERWLAISGEGRPIDAGREVTVSAVMGTTLVVWPADGLFPLLEQGSHDPGSHHPGSHQHGSHQHGSHQHGSRLGSQHSSQQGSGDQPGEGRP
jgi:hypothetical protein